MPSSSSPHSSPNQRPLHRNDRPKDPNSNNNNNNNNKSKKDEDSDANIRNFAPVARIMKTALPENAKIAKEAKECMQECVSEFISFITSEGTYPPPRPARGMR